jgi:hypothetical protein
MEECNLPHEKTSRFKIYNGRNVDAMPKLISDGRIPMNVAQLMQRRIDLRNDNTGVKDFYMGNYFDTGDMVLYHPNGNVKVVYTVENGQITEQGRKLLEMINPQSKRNGGALILEKDVYSVLQGEVFKKDELGKTGDWMSKADVKAHPVWRVLARDQALLDDYTDYIFTEGKKSFNYDTAMGVFPGSCSGNALEMRAWYVSGLGGRSIAGGGYDLDDVDGRSVGIAPEALKSVGSGVSAVRTYTMGDVQKAREELTLLEKTIRPESLDRVKTLIGKL